MQKEAIKEEKLEKGRKRELKELKERKRARERQKERERDADGEKDKEGDEVLCGRGTDGFEFQMVPRRKVSTHCVSLSLSPCEQG